MISPCALCCHFHEYGLPHMIMTCETVEITRYPIPYKGTIPEKEPDKLCPKATFTAASKNKITAAPINTFEIVISIFPPVIYKFLLKAKPIAVPPLSLQETISPVFHRARAAAFPSNLHTYL